MEEFQRTLSPCSSLSSYVSSCNPDPLSIDVELWLMAEQRAHEVLCTVQPNVVSELRRKEVMNYIQGLINGYFGNEVFPFGSAPLKTYLPDGDIDLTIICQQNMEEDLARSLCSILKGEEGSEFQVKDVQYIHAQQVKIVKCTVKNISVDISFNQLAGLHTLCFLEQVDQLVGKDHLFKRSILLIKAWCYYESRILGAHHGLISTYALETMVLYIVNFFYGSICGPLEVLYRFLEYYSTFDWHNYCVSINGPVSLSTITEIEFETPEDNMDGLLLSKEFLKNCRDIYSVPIRAQEARGQEFSIKRLNILDPLKYNNNLGRCVSKGNFHRIICALSYGAQKLGEILMLPGESIGGALEKFFMTTLERNGSGQRPDVPVPVPAFGTGRTEISDLGGDYDSYYGGLWYGQWYYYYTLPVYIPPSPIPSQMWNENAMDTLARSVWGHQNVIYHRGTDVFVPTLPLYYPNASQISAVAAYSIERTGRSRGTGTYIPDMTRHFYRDMHNEMTSAADSSFPESMQHALLLESAEESPEESPEERDKVEEVSSERGECQSSIPLDLSIKEFPLLNGNEKSSSECQSSMPPDLSIKEFPHLKGNGKSTMTMTEIGESSELAAKTQQAQVLSPTLMNMEFGTFKDTLVQAGSTSPGINNQAVASVSHPLDPRQCVTVIGRQEQKELSEGKGKMYCNLSRL
ncbi:hypothetical protein FEM48_Zijuj03G0116900 [Ziziphus jujuba var. spinosa]|uniref:Polymerase nucleotidyl transferase domain-containing protein n=1 Tax=Ziziphus jujuba var. spinosa TaxID=714518 RepID=A0A978VQ39_ZIZJJ|nr:hypothetical protein FEM48_Zijuj03G0116900 [Ziziphus jujuba var. spinosa]